MTVPPENMWKYVATIAISILLAGTPGIVYAVRTWNVVSDVERIRDRQDEVRLRLVVLEEQMSALQARVMALEERR